MYSENAEENRFKFRAWNKEWDEMVYSTTKHECDLKREFTPWLFDVGFSRFPKEGWVIMQCMDKADKNGTLIYDGDILRVTMEFRAYEGAEPEYRTLIGQITFQSGGFWFHGSGWSINNWHHYNAADLEVLGNIYENAELLVDSRPKIRGLNE